MCKIGCRTIRLSLVKTWRPTRSTWQALVLSTSKHLSYSWGLAETAWISLNPSENGSLMTQLMNFKHGFDMRRSPKFLSHSDHSESTIQPTVDALGREAIRHQTYFGWFQITSSSVCQAPSKKIEKMWHHDGRSCFPCFCSRFPTVLVSLLRFLDYSKLACRWSNLSAAMEHHWDSIDHNLQLLLFQLCHLSCRWSHLLRHLEWNRETEPQKTAKTKGQGPRRFQRRTLWAGERWQVLIIV